jgi:hypothetical protein
MARVFGLKDVWFPRPREIFLENLFHKEGFFYTNGENPLHRNKK